MGLVALDGSNGFRLDGVNASDRSGFSVSSAGDVNGDGFDDVIIGARYADPGGDGDAGACYVVFGKGNAFAATLSLASLDGANGFRLDGIDAGDLAATSVSTAGDVNGDGFDDVIVGANGADNGEGESYVVFGKAGGFTASLDLGTLDGANGFRIDGVDVNDQSGFSVSDAGDVNGDGISDLIIGARNADPGFDGNAGESYVVFGKAGGFAASLDLATLDGANGFRLDGIDAYDTAGFSVASAGDVNGDGFDDVIIGARGANPGGDSYAGESYVVFGKASGFAASLDLATLNGANGFRIDGIDANDLSGRSVSAAGDVNGDGFGDIIIGAFGADADGDINAGESYVVFGKAGGFAASLSLTSLGGADGFRLDGIDDFDLSGYSVSAAGDFNGDGFDDILVGARGGGPNNGGPGADAYSGETYILFGKASGFAGSLDLGSLDGISGIRFDGIDAGDLSGFSVSAAGDVNGDGYDDIVIGAPGGVGSAGESYVVFGFPTTTPTISGGAGADLLTGGAFAEALEGKGGADTLRGGGGGDTLDGGSGSDWADYSGAAEKVKADLKSPGANTGDAAGDVYVSIENLRGTKFKDLLLGDDFANRIEGRGKNDNISGRDGDDTLAGGAGRDTLKGGAGADRFELASLAAADADNISDFAAGDKIALDGATYGLAPGALAGNRFVTGTAAGDGNDRIIYNDANGKLYFDADGTGAQAQVLIATLTGPPALGAGDFVVI